MYAVQGMRRPHCAHMAAFLCLLLLLPRLISRDSSRSWGAASPSEEGGSSGGTPSSEPYPAYKINEIGKCPEGKAPPFLVLLIATQAHEVEARDAIRRTWGDENLAPALGVVRLFLLGVKEGELGRLQQRALASESLRHHDIIQQDFVDTYHNLTLKTLMGMQWVATHCPRAAYVMKTDSDMFVNTHYLIHNVLRPELKPKDNYYTGYVHWNQAGPHRHRTNKWYVSRETYPSEKYPAFCAGSGYVISGGLAARIYRASLSVRRLYLEDVYVGMCVASLGIGPTSPPGNSVFNGYHVSYSSGRYRRLVTSHEFSPGRLLEIWPQVAHVPAY